MTKIAFWQTVGDAFGFVFSDWGRFFRLATLWIVVGTILFACLATLFGLEAVQKPAPGAHEPLTAGRAVTSLVFLVYAIIAYVAFAVAWHRAVLLGEAAGAPLRAARFQWREMRFLMYSIVIALLAIGVFVVAALIVGGLVVLMIAGGKLFSDFESGPAIGAAVAAVLVAAIAILPFLARFSLGLPAIAVEEPEGVFGRSWHRGWRNGWRLIWGPFVCSLPLAIVSGIFQGAQLLSILLAGAGDAWRAVGLVLLLIFYLLGTTAHFFAIALAVSFLSLAYRQLTRNEAVAAAT